MKQTFVLCAVASLLCSTLAAQVGGAGRRSHEPADLKRSHISTGTTYYVDNVSGSDGNSGLSPAAAFATIAKVNTLALAPGQTVAFKTNGTWHETLVVSTSGASGTPITYTSYGRGAQPVIDASDAVTGWIQGTGIAAQQACASPCLFSSGFETPNFADWTSTNVANPSSDSLTISTANPSHGAGAMLMSSTDGADGRIWVTKSSPASVGMEHLVGVRIYIKTPAGSYKPNVSPLLISWQSNGTEVMNTSITADSNGNPATINTYAYAPAQNILPYNTPLTGYNVGVWNELEVDVSTSSTTGGGTVYLNGKLLGQVSNLNASSLAAVNGIEIGNTSYGKLAAGAAISIDDAEVAVGTLPIGPFVGGTPVTVWAHPQTTNPRLVNFMGQSGTPVNAVSAVLSPNQFYWDGANLYVYSLLDPSSIVEIPARTSSITSAGANFIDVNNLEFRGAAKYAAFCGSTLPCTNWDFEGNTFNASVYNLIYWIFENGVSAANLVVNGNTFKGAGSSGIKLANGGIMNAAITNNTFYDLCKVYDSSFSESTYCDAVYGYSQTGTDDSAVYVGFNYIHDIGVGQVQQYGGGIHADTVPNWDIEHNVVMNTNLPGINMEKGSGSVSRFNLLVNTGTYKYVGGLMIRAGEGWSVSNQLAEYNTIVGGWWACNLGITQDAGAVTATNITMRKNICSGATSGTQFYADQGASGPGNAFTSNNFGAAAPNFINYAGSGYDSYNGLPSTITGSMPGTPMFTNPLVNDFTLQSASSVVEVGAFPTYKPAYYYAAPPAREP